MTSVPGHPDLRWLGPTEEVTDDALWYDGRPSDAARSYWYVSDIDESQLKRRVTAALCQAGARALRPPEEPDENCSPE